MKKYSIIGGNPFTMYTGTTTYTSLKCIGLANTEDEVKAILDANYEACGGLLLVIDLETGKEANLPCGF